jgi:hypothetical protein
MMFAPCADRAGGPIAMTCCKKMTAARSTPPSHGFGNLMDSLALGDSKALVAGGWRQAV